MNHKEMTSHIRNRIKANGIKASVRKYESCGSLWIQVSPTTYEASFSSDEQRAIRRIAKVNALTFARGLEIIEDQDTDSKGANFVFHGSRK